MKTRGKMKHFAFSAALVLVFCTSGVAAAQCNRIFNDDITIWGGFANDRGCMFSAVSIKGKKGKLTRAQATPLVLAKLGWKKAKKEARKKLAMRWVRGGLVTYLNPLDKKPKKFPKKFTKPKVVIHKGQYVVSLWSRNPTGMMCGTGYERLVFTIGKNGELKSRKRADGMFIKCK